MRKEIEKSKVESQEGGSIIKHYVFCFRDLTLEKAVSSVIEARLIYLIVQGLLQVRSRAPIDGYCYLSEQTFYYLGSTAVPATVDYSPQTVAQSHRVS